MVSTESSPQTGRSDQVAARVWRDPRTFAFNLLVMFIDAYGDERDPEDDRTMAALRWQPETVLMQVADDFGVDLPDVNFDKLMTAISVLTSNAFFFSEADFVHDCLVLAGTAAQKQSLVMPDSSDLAWGVTEALLISPADPGDEAFSPEIRGFISETLNAEGIMQPPSVLRFAAGGETADRVNDDFSDDPEMFAAIWSLENDKTKSIDQLVKRRSEALLGQLLRLPLRHGSGRVADRLLRRLAAMQ